MECFVVLSFFRKESDEISSKFMVGLCDLITKAWGEIEDCEQELLGIFFFIYKEFLLQLDFFNN